MEGTAYKIRYNIPLAREITPIYRNPCKKCIIQACCSRPCRGKAIYESGSYWRKVKLKHILVNTSVAVISMLIVVAYIWILK